MFEIIPIDKIRPAKDNLRKNVGDVTELAANIRTFGLLQALLVTPADKHGMHTLVAGHRRYAALQLAGITEVDCSVRDVKRIGAMFSENFHRKDLSALEIAYGFQRMIDEEGLSQRRIADEYGCNQSYVSRKLMLLELPPWAQQLVERFEDPADDRPGLTLRQAEAIVPAVKQPAVLDELRKRLTRKDVSEWDIDHAVNRAVTDLDRIRKTDASRERLATLNVREVGYPAQGWYTPTAKIKVLGGGYYGVGVTEAKHKSLDCHAACVDPRTGEIVFVCTQPANHKTATPRRQLSPAEIAERVRKKELAEATKFRRSALASHLTTVKRPPRDAIDIALRQLVLQGDDEAQRYACEFLQLDVPVVQRYRGGAGVHDYEKALLDFAGRGQHELARAALAVALGRGEAVLGGQYSSWDGPAAQAHLGYLAKVGYELTPAEKAKLPKPPRARKAPAKKAAAKKKLTVVS